MTRKEKKQTDRTLTPQLFWHCSTGKDLPWIITVVLLNACLTFHYTFSWRFRWTKFQPQVAKTVRTFILSHSRKMRNGAGFVSQCASSFAQELPVSLLSEISAASLCCFFLWLETDTFTSFFISSERRKPQSWLHTTVPSPQPVWIDWWSMLAFPWII